MSLFSIFMTGIGLSMDAFAVALAKGITLKKDIFKNSIKVALFFGGFQALMPFIGWWAGKYFESYIKSFDHWIAFILLSIIGGKMLIEATKDLKGKTEKTIENTSDNEFSYKNLTILAIATSIDALAVGVSFSFLSVDIIPSIVIIGVTTFILSFFAVFLGKKLSKYVQNYAEIIGGLILIFIGIKILTEHLMM